MRKSILKLKFLTVVAFSFVLTVSVVYGQKEMKALKPRIVVLTDVSTWETDDSESLVSLLVHADMFEIEGLIYTTGWNLEETRDDFFQLIHDAIDAYEKDLPNLLKRSDQIDFKEDESPQPIGYWPSPDYLRKRTMFGSKKRGIDKIGKDNISDGSNLIIELADENDDRPLWILIWGGGNTLAQAIWQVQQERNDVELKTFLHKIPCYAITDQDRSYKEGTPFDISSHQWMRKEFEKDLVFLWDECAWKYQNGKGKDKWDEYELNIQNHGNIGKVYPKYKYGVEGDTPPQAMAGPGVIEGDSPSFLYLVSANRGINNPGDPTQPSWGGQYVRIGLTNHYTDGLGNSTISRWSQNFQTDFMERADWMLP